MDVADVTDIDFASLVRPGDMVMWGQADAEPLPLTRELMSQRHAIGGRFRAFIGLSLADTVDVAHTDVVDFASYCGAGRNRLLARADRLEVWPTHYLEIAARFASGATPVDVLLLQLAPPDAHGRFSLGIAYEYLVPALDRARCIIAEVNEQAPWTHGERYLTAADLHIVVHTSRPPLHSPLAASGDVEMAIARRAAALIEDGSTLQTGIGNLPALVLAELRDRHDLGIHSGTIGDAVADLVDSGAVTNACKSIDRGVSTTGTLMGTGRIHEFAHRNSMLQFRATTYTHDPQVLASIDRFVSLNSAVEVDLTGQINTEVANGVYVGAVGGALDFARGAQRSRGGAPILVLPSRAGNSSRIVANLSGPVTIPRSDAGIVVTEYGAADLRGLPIRQRFEAMLAIAHPDCQAALERSLSKH